MASSYEVIGQEKLKKEYSHLLNGFKSFVLSQSVCHCLSCLVRETTVRKAEEAHSLA